MAVEVRVVTVGVFLNVILISFVTVEGIMVSLVTGSEVTMNPGAATGWAGCDPWLGLKLRPPRRPWLPGFTVWTTGSNSVLVVTPTAWVRVVKNFLAPKKRGMVEVEYMVSVLYTGVLVVIT